MADSPFKGLLYSPEVLGGIGLLTAGLSGQNPGAALPMLTQGMKTAAMFNAMEKEEEKKKLIKEYESQVPEDQRALFKAFPLEWLKKNKFTAQKPNLKEIFDPTLNDGKGGFRYEKASVIANNPEKFQSKPVKKIKPDLITMKSPDGKDIVSLNLGNPEDITKLENLLKQNYTEFEQKVSADNVSGLTNTTKNKIEKDIRGNEVLLGQLEATEVMFEDEFLTYGGKIRYQKIKLLDKAGVKLSDDDAAYLRRYSTWEQGNLQYFNQYRKEITGVAAGEKEIAWLEASIPSAKDTPAAYRAKMKNQIRIQKELIEKAKQYKADGGKVYEIKDGERVYSEGFGKYLKNKIKPSGEYLDEMFKSYKVDYQYSPEKAIELMNIQFPNQNWEEILEMYIKGKTGAGL
jgi:hypothetical protein